jgi:hypothetical protein
MTTADGTAHLKSALSRLGIRVSGVTNRAGTGLPLKGTKLSTHTSATLRDILFTQNAHSINNTAERVGEAVGGPRGVESFLTGTLGIPGSELHISHTSGLDYNRITPRGTVHLLSEMMRWLAKRNMEPEDIMPVAGIDSEHWRLDSGPTTIVGQWSERQDIGNRRRRQARWQFSYKDRGPILFAIFNTRGSVTVYRQLQDSLLKELIVQSSGPQPPQACAGLQLKFQPWVDRH